MISLGLFFSYVSACARLSLCLSVRVCILSVYFHALAAVAEPVLDTCVIHVTTFRKFRCFSRLFSACTSYPSFSSLLDAVLGNLFYSRLFANFSCVFLFVSFFSFLLFFFWYRLFSMFERTCVFWGWWWLTVVSLSQRKKNACRTNARHRHISYTIPER